jgi:hypothetical protein
MWLAEGNISLVQEKASRVEAFFFMQCANACRNAGAPFVVLM